MRSHAFILALCVCAHHTRAASIALDLDNVDLDEDRLNVVSSDRPGKPGDIPVKVVEEPVLDENSNDYIPPDDTSVNVKRIEVDLTNPGPPQRQEHETQNPENFSDNDKIAVAIKHSIEQTENVLNEGLKHVSDSFKTFLRADENLPLIQQNIKNLKENFNGQFEKLNETITAYLKPQISSSGESTVNPKLAIVQAQLKYLDNHFKLSLDTLTEGVEVYSIIKEEDEAEKSIALKADIKAEPEVASGVPLNAVEKPPPKPGSTNPGAPADGTSLWNMFLSNIQNSMNSVLQNIGNTFNSFNGNNNANGQASQEKPGPPNTQADPVPAPPPAPWGPQALFQSLTNFINPSQNNQQTPQNSQPANTNPFQQVYQNVLSFITPQTPPAQLSSSNTPNHTPAIAVAPEKAPEKTPSDKPLAAVPNQGSNVLPAPVNEQPQEQPGQAANPVPSQTGPIQQLVQDNPIIKGIQSAVQRIQGTPNPETPREEIIQENQNKEKMVNSKGHYHGGHRPDNNVTNQGDSSDSGRVDEKVKEKVEEKLQDIPTEEKDVLDEQIKAEELKTPPVSDKTE